MNNYNITGIGVNGNYNNNVAIQYALDKGLIIIKNSKHV